MGMETDDAGKKKSLEDELQTWLPNGANIKLAKVDGWESSDQPLVASFDVELSSYCSAAGKRLLLPAYLFRAKQMDVFKLSGRKFPVYFPYAFGEVDKVNIKIPNGYTLESMPKEQNARLGYASYQNLVQFDGQKVVTQRILQVNGIYFRVELYPKSKISSARSKLETNSRRFSVEAAPMLKKATSTALFLFSMVFLPSHANAAVPDWVRSAAQQPARAYASDANAVILLHETETTVKDSGETITRERRVIKMLRPEGRSSAYQGVPFDEETRLNYFKGWSISAKGLEYEAKKDDVAEVAAGEGYEIYSDAKAKVMRIPGVDVGTIVGVEWEQKRHPYTFEDQWFFQSSTARAACAIYFCTCRQPGSFVQPGCTMPNKSPRYRAERTRGTCRISPGLKMRLRCRPGARWPDSSS